MLPQPFIESLAREFFGAEKSRTQIQQISLRHPDITIDDAYAIQRRWVQMKIDGGNRLKGHKIGLTSRAMQMAVGINEPDCGALLEDMFFSDGATIPTERFIAPRVEVELAFIMDRRLEGPNVTLFDVLDAVRYVTPALEIIDSRSHMVDPETKRTRKVFDTIADNAANAGVVMGGRPVRAGDLDLRWVSAILSQNAVIEETGVAAGVLNHPANGVAWLANKLAGHGVALEKDQVILGGSFTRPVLAKKGDTLVVDYGPLGTVSCHFG
ncbi:2-oxo-hept-4-ene-1,7-dioate hydratase [Achromobacter animicus]|uniref:2-oxo-hept-4-ene-1,7-dioate hydratase n=1 Tax=Achromobacter animicus TaxID=1389935 RepID=UPI002448731F|nr:2-oxo-hepta-3-ene-1,7-dioic acid hydratase [Achromobacter animicus]MDH0686356.1 2-oxo-hepta-3-ene-1,7-dioic acid hydratase [Achromobacter animicus]